MSATDAYANAAAIQRLVNARVPQGVAARWSGCSVVAVSGVEASILYQTTQIDGVHWLNPQLWTPTVGDVVDVIMAGEVPRIQGKVS